MKMGGLQTAAFRNQMTRAYRKLIATAGVPIVGPSGNTSGDTSQTNGRSRVARSADKIAGVLDDGLANPESS